VIMTVCTCNGQIRKNTISKRYKPKTRAEMKVLDKEIVTRVTIDKEYKYSDADTVITVSKPSERVNFYQTIEYPNTNFKNIAIYDRTTLKLITEGQTFLKMPIGVHKIYNKDGKIEKTINYDENFPLDIEEIIRMVEANLKIDMNVDIKGMSISREINKIEKIPVYNIYIPQDESIVKQRHIKIHAVTGEILLDIIDIPQQ